MNWINLVLSVVAIALFVTIRVCTNHVNKLEAIKHNSNPAFQAAGFPYEHIKMPWVFHAMLALAIFKLIEQIAILSGACN